MSSFLLLFFPIQHNSSKSLLLLLQPYNTPQNDRSHLSWIKCPNSKRSSSPTWQANISFIFSLLGLELLILKTFIVELWEWWKWNKNGIFCNHITGDFYHFIPVVLLYHICYGNTMFNPIGRNCLDCITLSDVPLMGYAAKNPWSIITRKRSHTSNNHYDDVQFYVVRSSCLRSMKEELPHILTCLNCW